MYETGTALQQREENVRETVANSSPVPENFQQALTWAAGACMKAIQAAVYRQSMYFNSGEKAQSGSDLVTILQFALEFSNTIAQTKLFKQRAGDGVRVVFADYGAYSVASASVTEDSPKNVKLDYLPAYSNSGMSPDVKVKFMDFCNASMIVMVAPTQVEASAIFMLFKVMEQEQKALPVVFMNPKLSVADPTGAIANQLRALQLNTVPVFHLEQMEPPKNSELNPSVISRVYPRPFSAWEDNPDDPDSVNGFFLLDVNDTKPLTKKELLDLLKMSRNMFLKIRNDTAMKRPDTLK